MGDRKAGHEILRLHAQHPLGRHRQYQINGLTFRLVQDDLRIAKDELVKADDALARRAVELSASPQGVPDPGRLGVEADIPGEIGIGRLDQRLDLNFDRQKMRDPSLDHRAESYWERSDLFDMALDLTARR